jgi:hypothetical protein
VFIVNNIWIVGGRSLNVNNIWVVGRGATTGGFDQAALVETADSVRPDQRCDDWGGSMKLLSLNPQIQSQIQSDPTRGATTGGLDEAAQVESADSVRPDQRHDDRGAQ